MWGKKKKNKKGMGAEKFDEENGEMKKGIGGEWREGKSRDGKQEREVALELSRPDNEERK